MDRTGVTNVDSIMELMSEVNIGAEGGAASTHYISPNYYADTSGPTDVNEDPPEAKTEDTNVLKSWREGMEIKATDDSTAKTMFISQNLNKAYEEKEQSRTLVAYSSCVAKVLRETDYFNAILNRVGEDLKLSEKRTSKEQVLAQREKMKKKLNNVKDVIDAFVSKFLVGEPGGPVDLASIKNALEGIAEFAFLRKEGDKKLMAEGCVSLNMCTDCNVEITPVEGQDLEAAMVLHSQTELHKTSMPEPPPPRKSKVEGTAMLIPPTESNDKKAVENLKKSPILRLNKISACLIDDNVACEVCDVVFASNVQEIFKHMSEAVHKDKLNTYNMEAQRSIIEKNQDVFGEGGQFQLNSVHTNLHKIFVDPSIKQAYCGLCCRQLPFSQSNIDEHIASVKHDKLLIDAVEFGYAEFAALGIDHVLLSSIKAKSTNNMESATKEIKPKRDPPPNNPQKDEQVILDVSDIQNFRKVLPDKPIRSIPDIFDSNNMPIQNFDYYEQPELKKFLIDNGLQRQPGGKFKCTYCPNLEIPNSRYAFRHISKHKTSTGSSPGFENWKRQPNRQQGYMNEQQKYGRVVMHKNGVNYWCTSCRLPLIDASTAFAHVKTDGHVMFVDGVSFSSGTIFDCSTCKTTINGEKNACQHLVAAKHRENSKIEAMAKQEGRMNMIEERKQKQMENRKANEAQRKDKASGDYAPTQSEEDVLFSRNGIIFSPDSGIYHCSYCGWSNRKRPDMLVHIFSYEHTTCMSKNGR